MKKLSARVCVRKFVTTQNDQRDNSADTESVELAHALAVLHLVEPPKPQEVQKLVYIVYALQLLQDLGKSLLKQPSSSNVMQVFPSYLHVYANRRIVLSSFVAQCMRVLTIMCIRRSCRSSHANCTFAPRTVTSLVRVIIKATN